MIDTGGQDGIANEHRGGLRMKQTRLMGIAGGCRFSGFGGFEFDLLFWVLRFAEDKFSHTKHGYIDGRLGTFRFV